MCEKKTPYEQFVSLIDETFRKSPQCDLSRDIEALECAYCICLCGMSKRFFSLGRDSDEEIERAQYDCYETLRRLNFPESALKFFAIWDETTIYYKLEASPVFVNSMGRLMEGIRHRSSL